MKLVEILAKKLSEWPESDVCITQDSGGAIYGWAQAGAKYRDYAWYSPDGKDFGMHDIEIEDPDEASDHKKSVVTQAKWQAERDRQEGGGWKRHRGGKCPVHGDQHVEVKFRDGAIEQSHASDFFGWKHREIEDADAHIMQYRIISQPQAEEVEVNKLEGRDVRLEYLMTGNKLPYEVHCGEVIHGPISIGDEVVAPAHPKWDQVESPFKWRDTVSELDAYIEKFTRERDALINRLALEGFALIQKINLNLDKIDATLDMSDWRNWKAGDVVECTESDFENVYTVGNYYKVAKVTSEYARVQDGCGPESYCHINDVHCATLGFIRRP